MELYFHHLKIAEVAKHSLVAKVVQPVLHICGRGNEQSRFETANLASIKHCRAGDRTVVIFRGADLRNFAQRILSKSENGIVASRRPSEFRAVVGC